MKKIILLVGIVMILLVSGCDICEVKYDVDCLNEKMSEHCEKHNCVIKNYYVHKGCFIANGMILDLDTREKKNFILTKDELGECLK